ncbi:MAG: GNAT family N-acetyltransferase [Phenylobacterium sp.]|nr:GNAT family N-acetyltransferase [Phenylobacterium sp.]
MMEDFRGGYEGLAEAVQAAWADVDQALLYTPDFLRSMLAYPGAGPRLAPTLYDGETPVGFAAGLPRPAECGGRPLSVVVGSFFSVSPTRRGEGIAFDLMAALIERARAEGHDATLLYCADGGAMNGVVQRCTDAMAVPTARVQSVRFISRILLPRKGEDGGEADDPMLAPALADLAARAPKADLRRRWTVEEADWQVNRREGALAVRLARGPRQGVLAGYVQQVAEGDRPLCLFIDDILWGDLEAGERKELVAAFIAKARLRGARLAVAPQTGWADLTPFAEAHFKPSARVLHAYLSSWNSDVRPESNLGSMYMDVF